MYSAYVEAPRYHIPLLLLKHQMKSKAGMVSVVFYKRTEKRQESVIIYAIL